MTDFDPEAAAREAVIFEANLRYPTRIESALDRYGRLREAKGAVGASKRVVPLCGDHKGGWCTTLFADAAGYGWCQVHELRRSAQAELAAAEQAIRDAAGGALKTEGKIRGEVDNTLE